MNSPESIMESPPRPELVDIGLALRHEGIALVGDILWHAERGVTEDIFAAYGRLVKLAGRVLSPVRPASQANGQPLIPFTAQSIPAARVATLYAAIGAALRNATALDSERHWRDADSAMKGFALAEALWWKSLAVQARDDAAAYRYHDQLDEAEHAEAIAAERDAKVLYYNGLAAGIGW